MGWTVADHSGNELYRAAMGMILTYQREGWITKTIASDPASAMLTAKPMFNQKGIMIVRTAPKIPEYNTESSVGRIKRKEKVIYFGLPFKLLKRHSKHLFKFAMRSLNATLGVNGVPNELVYKRKETGEYFNFPFGQVVWAHQKGRKFTSDPKPPAELAIYLGQQDSEGCAVVFLLESGIDAPRYDLKFAEPTPSVLAKMKYWGSLKGELQMESEQHQFTVPDTFGMQVPTTIDGHENDRDVELDEETEVSMIGEITSALVDGSRGAVSQFQSIEREFEPRMIRRVEVDLEGEASIEQIEKATMIQELINKIHIAEGRKRILKPLLATDRFVEARKKEVNVHHKGSD